MSAASTSSSATASGGTAWPKPTLFLNRKVKAALAAGLTVILCVGETLYEREAKTDAGSYWSSNSPPAWPG